MAAEAARRRVRRITTDIQAERTTNGPAVPSGALGLGHHVPRRTAGRQACRECWSSPFEHVKALAEHAALGSRPGQGIDQVGWQLSRRGDVKQV